VELALAVVELVDTAPVKVPLLPTFRAPSIPEQHTHAHTHTHTHIPLHTHSL